MRKIRINEGIDPRTIRKIVDVLRDAGGNAERLSRVTDILSLLGNATGDSDFSRASEEINATSGLPLTTKELAIGGRELAAMGIIGRDMGTAMKTAIAAIYDGHVSNDQQELLDFLST